MSRNKRVEEAVNVFIKKLDKLSQGETLGEPTSAKVKNLFDEVEKNQSNSVMLACAFFSSYCIVDKCWDFKSVPIGIRGKYGDKSLSSQLASRNVTIHNNITAFGENLGWKGNVRRFDLSEDERFGPFLKALEDMTQKEQLSLLHHVAWRFHNSRVTPSALPPLPDNYLSYGRSVSLCEDLINIPSEGHIQQFLVAAYIEIHRKRYGHRVVTHHPHASDSFDKTTGDIEEYRETELVAAYEVTARDDWKNRIPDFRQKMVSSGVIFYERIGV